MNGFLRYTLNAFLVGAETYEALSFAGISGKIAELHS
jgi:hypothetical protein